MSELTKKALAQSFIKLCNTKDLNKIIVQDIVDDCGVNRNTFYYHFGSIYDVLDYIFTSEEEKFVGNIEDFSNWKTGIMAIVDEVTQYKPLIINVYNSLNRAQLERYLYNVTSNLVYQYIKKTVGANVISKDNLAIVIDFFKCALVGVLLEWIEKGMKGDMIELSNKLDKMSNGLIEQAIKNLK